VRPIGELLQRVDAGCVKSRHVAQPQDHNISKLGEIPCGFDEFLGCSKQEWAMNAQNSYIRRNLFVLKNMRLTIFQILGSDSRDSSRLRNTIDVKERRKGHTYSDGDGEVRQNGQSKGRDPNGNVRLRQPKNDRNLTRFTHIVGNDKKDGREGCQWWNARPLLYQSR